MPHPSQPERLWITAFALAFAFDLLFWGTNPGLSFTLWIVLCLTGLFLNAYWQKKRPSWLSYPLATVTIALAATNMLRAEPFSRGFSAFLAMSCLALLAATLLSGNWLFYRLGDYVIASFKLLAAAIVRGAGNHAETPAQVNPPAQSDAPAVKKPQTPNPMWQFVRRTFPVVRGLIITLPILGVLGALLASADPVFGDRLRAVLGVFDLRHLPEYLFRLVYILVFSYAFGGLFLHAVLPYPTEERPDPNTAWKSRFLGSTECFVILSGVILLFVFFLALQFRYLFGGQANISETGYTYSDYARRGFFELVWVTVLTIALYLGLGTITRRETPAIQRTFSVFSILLLALLLLILISALQRMLLYEAAYGFTRLRSYTHIFILWLGALLLAAMVLEGVRRPGHFGLAFLIFTLGFGLTFTFLNLDGTIARLDIDRARAGFDLDVNHLTALSADAIPTLANAYLDKSLPDAARQRSGAALACYSITAAAHSVGSDWREYNYPAVNALKIVNGLDLKRFIVNSDRGKEVQVNGETINCYGYSSD